MYIDESGIDTCAYRSHGWSQRGEKIYGEISGKRYARESFIAGQCNKKILAPMCYSGTCNAALFNTWLKKCLIPELKPGQVIVMDNAAIHKSELTQILIKQAGCKLLYLPPYSPDLNPIEQFWGILKRKIRNTISSFNSLQDSVNHAFKHYGSKLV